jgi:hypothetical protein
MLPTPYEKFFGDLARLLAVILIPSPKLPMTSGTFTTELPVTAQGADFSTYISEEDDIQI